MKLQRGISAIVTGASSGIGQAVALHLAAHGVGLSLVDFDDAGGLSTKAQAEALGGGGSVIFTRADVAEPSQLAAAFVRHVREFGQLDICFNNAGVGEPLGLLMSDTSEDGSGAWRRVLDINLVAMVDGTRLAAQAMLRRGNPGVIINVASAAGLYPNPDTPIYCASKGGVVLFTLAMAKLAKSRIRVNALCPEFVDTGIVKAPMSDESRRSLGKAIALTGGFIPMRVILEGVMEMVEDESVAGRCMWITNRHGRRWWAPPPEKQQYKAVPEQKEQFLEAGGGVPTVVPQMSVGGVMKVEDAALSSARNLPQTYKKIVVVLLSSDFRKATSIVSAPMKLPLPPGTVLVRVHFAGINASDVNFSAGRYAGSMEEASKKLPFDAGFEAIGVVVAKGEGVENSALAVGRAVAVLQYGAFSEFMVVRQKAALPLLAGPTREAVALLTSGLTASIALEQAGAIRKGQTVLVTAAAGGTGQLAVQLAKLAGCTVVATCGSEPKARLLRRLGANHVINYSSADVSKELKRLFPKGVDVVYESVGGAMFEVCFNSLARSGRLIVIGMMSQYTSGEGGTWAAKGYPGLCEKLLWKSQSIVGFFLLHYMGHMARHFERLQHLHATGKLQVAVDGMRFCGVGAVASAVEHLHSGRSVGKVVVDMLPSGSLHEARL